MTHIGDTVMKRTDVNIPGHVFREYDIRGVVDKDLTLEFVSLLGRALGSLYARENVKAVAVGMDARASSLTFRDELVKGLLGSGIDVYDMGLSLPYSLLCLIQLGCRRRSDDYRKSQSS